MAVPLLLALAFAAQGPPLDLARIGTLRDPAIREASGLVQSRRHPGIFWTHNDSENPNTIFAVRADGSLVRAFTVNALNVDWEDIAIDDGGHLYIGDIGNNGNRLPLRAVYQIDEPDPTAREVPKRALPVTRKSYYTFPPGGRFDAEALVVGPQGETAWLVAKTFDGRDAEVYVLPLAHAPLLKPARPERFGTLPGFTEPVTGAGLSADGRRLAVCSNAALGVYEPAPQGAAWKRIALRAFRPREGVEAVAWDGGDLVLADEGRGIYRVPEAAWRGTGKASRRAARDVRR